MLCNYNNKLITNKKYIYIHLFQLASKIMEILKVIVTKTIVCDGIARDAHGEKASNSETKLA